MSTPPTLRDVSGLGSSPPGLKGSALILIDIQNTYREGVMLLEGVEPAIAEAALLLARAREAGIPIFHIQHDAGVGSPYDVSARIGAISDEVAPRAGEAVIVKNYPNAFIHTDLEALVAASGAKDLILAGFMTHMCVNSTARGAFNLGFRPAIVAATTATRDLPGVDGAIVPAAAVQAASLAAVGDLFAIVTPRASDIPA
jgi:nicotinamidase-related amidase